ncbi:MAG: MBL fold metallo-hydrolase [Gemmatimonadota bacterium]
MRLTVVGSGTAAPEPERVCSGYGVETAATRLLLDCGPGVVHRMAALGVPWPRLDHVLFTHFHNDHTGDLPTLFFALKWGVVERRTAPLTLWAPRGIRDRLRAMEAAFGDHVADPGFPVVVREIGPGESFTAGDVVIAVANTPHTPESVAYRIDRAGVRLGYTGDTGPSEELGPFFTGCDVLLAECSLPDEEATDNHLSPASLAALATAAAPHRLVVTHVYPRLDALDPLALLRRAGWAGHTLRARDGLALSVGER